MVHSPAWLVVAYRLDLLLVSAHMGEERALLLGAAARPTQTTTKPIVICVRSCGARAGCSTGHPGGKVARKLCGFLVAPVLAKALKASVQGSSSPNKRTAMSDALSVAVRASLRDAANIF